MRTIGIRFVAGVLTSSRMRASSFGDSRLIEEVNTSRRLPISVSGLNRNLLHGIGDVGSESRT